MTTMNKHGLLIVLVGPSGCGKGTVLKEFFQNEANTFLSISATTRSPREGEADGINYYFITKPQFEQLIAEDGLLEYANYVGNYYGTPKKPVLERIERGENVILEIEMQGARKVLQMYPDAVSVFILPPSLEELRRRLVGRGTEDMDTVSRRLETAMGELTFAYECDYVIVNDDVTKAAAQFSAVIHAERCAKGVMKDVIDAVING